MKIIKFTAVWCMSCILVNQLFNKEFNLNTEIVNYDYDLDKDKVRDYNIGDILPVLIFVDNRGHEVRRLVGEVSKKELAKVFEELGVK